MIIGFGIFFLVIGFIAFGLEQSQYLTPYAGRFGYPINGAGVVIIGALMVASQIYYSSIILTLAFVAIVLIVWFLIGFTIKQMARSRETILIGKKGEAATDFMLNNNGIAYGKINIDGKLYRSFVAKEAKYETDTLPEIIQGQAPEISEAQRNLDTMSDVKLNPCLIHRGTPLLVMELSSMTPRVAMIKE